MTITERADQFVEAENMLALAVGILVAAIGPERGEDAALAIVAETVKRLEYRRQLATALARETAS